MCYLRLTRYACHHTSPIHPLDYIRPSAAVDKMQSNPNTEWPRHPDTGCIGCQDAGRRGARCGGPLEKLESFEEESERVCEDCLEWVEVGRDGEVESVKDDAKEKDGEKDGKES
jgi:hypothetical protein